MLEKLKGLSSAVKFSRRDNSSDEARYLIALDIGTEFVKALIGQVNGDSIEIIGVGRAHQELGDMQAGAIADIASVVANCGEALNQAEQQAGVSPRAAVIGIAGELVKGTTTTVRCTRKNQEKELDVPEFEKIIALVQERALVRARKELAWELGGKEIEIRLVNSAVVRIDIDEHKVTNPIGFKGKEVDIQLYTAFAPMIHIGALERTAQELELDLLAVAAEPFAVARSVIGNDSSASMSAILMDVGGGTTDLAVVNEGGVQGTKMFGIGGRGFTQSICRELGVDFSVAEQMKLAMGTKRISVAKTGAIEKALQGTLDIWLNGVELSLNEFSSPDYLPNRLLLCGGGSSLDLLVDRLEQDPWRNKLPFTRKLEVQHIDPGQVSGIIDRTGSVTDHTYITAMGLLRVGLDTLAQDSAREPGSIRERIDRILRV